MSSDVWQSQASHLIDVDVKTLKLKQRRTRFMSDPVCYWSTELTD